MNLGGLYAAQDRGCKVRVRKISGRRSGDESLEQGRWIGINHHEPGALS